MLNVVFRSAERFSLLSRVAHWGSLGILLALSALPARAASTGTTALHTPQGSGAATANGDYITGGLNALYRYFIEVPPGLGTLVVELFDPDIGRGGAAEATAGRDRARNGFDTQVDYTLIRPDGTTAATLNNCNDTTCTDNAWVTLLNSSTAANTAAGHWELRVDMTSAATGGDDINALGIRAHDGNSGAGGTELRIYYDSQSNVGVNPPGSGTVSRSYTLYPYVTSGCTASKNDFDFDSGSGNTGSIALSSRTAAFTQNYASTSLSTDNVWRRDSWSGWTSDQLATDYGIWQETRTITSYLVGGTPNGNYANVWYGNYQAAANPPAANPTTNAFRVYLPSDAGTAPVKPYLEQLLTFKLGTNPVPVGQTGIFQVTVRLVNPTPQSITFSAANLVTANVPGAGATYNGNAAVSQGSIIAQPAIGGTGNFTWNPGTVAAGATVLLGYQVRVTPTSAGQRIVVTATPASGNGTRATFVDETGNTTQARATFTFGPLCELATTQGVLTAAVVRSLATRPAAHGGLEVEWETASEAGTAGFYLDRWDPVAKRYRRVNAQLLAGLQGAPQGGRYRLLDRDASPAQRQRYRVEEVEASGGRREYGPFVTPAADRALPGDELQLLDAETVNRRAHAAPGRGAGDLIKATANAGAAKSIAPANAGAARSTAQAKASPPKPVPPPVAATGAALLSVRESGLYRLSSVEIAGWFGMTTAQAETLIGTGKLALSLGGEAVAWYPDLRFGGDKNPPGLYFYGEAKESLYSEVTPYKLARGKGMLMEVVPAAAAFPSAGGTFAESLHVERDLFAATALSLDPESDYWFWEFLQGDDPSFGRRTFSLDATGVDPSGAAALRVSLHGATASGVAGEHRALVRLNGVALGEVQWQGIEAQDGLFPIPGGTLRESANQVEIEARTGAGAPYSIYYVDSFDLAYRRALRADGGALAFSAEGSAPVTVTGFPRPDLKGLDLRDPKRPLWLGGLPVASDAAGFRTSFQTVSGARYLLATSGAVKRIASARAWSAPSLLDAGNRATYLVVAPAAWRAAAEGLAELRRAQGLEAKVVDLDQIADELADGASSPLALRSFLTWAHGHWAVPPRYVVLAGSGTVDYRDLLGMHDNVVPPLMVQTSEGLFPSDARLGDVEGDGLPEVAIGRVPVSSAAALAGYTAKLAAFERAAPGDWTGRALFLSDATDRGADFAAQSGEVAAQVARGYQVESLSLATTPLAAARALILARLNAGTAWVDYLGHGGLDRLAAGGLLASGDVPGLSNGDRLPVVTAMTCTVNRFAVPGVPALGEQLVARAGGGAIAVWGPTGLSLHGEAKLLAERFYRTTAEPESLRLGDRILGAEAEFRVLGGSAALLPLYALLGDPAIRLPAPPATPPGVSGTSGE